MLVTEKLVTISPKTALELAINLVSRIPSSRRITRLEGGKIKINKDIPEAIREAVIGILRPYVPQVETWLGQMEAGVISEKGGETYFTRLEVAGLLKVSVQTLDRLIKCGRLQATRIRRSVRISESALRAFLEEEAQ